MAMDQDFKDEVRSKNDIAEVIGAYVKLERRGERFVGLCPFHGEKTASFHVIPKLQIFHCFGCKATGDVFKFLQEREHQTFFEALRSLAQRAKVPMPNIERTPEEEQEYREKRGLYDALDLGARFFEHQLVSTAEGREKGLAYLLERGLTEETIKHFRLGWAPGHGHLKKQLSVRFNYDIMQRADLIKPGRQGGFMDTFYERVMFPITDINGRVLGFGGRLLEGEGAKYKNTADTQLFAKRHVLFGLSQAKEHMRSKNQAILVEGYMDVIMPYQYGIKNIVAPLGTALTAEQCQLIRQQVEEVIVAFDPDTAGQMATIRGLELLYNAGCTVKVMRIPDGMDPDEYIKANGAEAFLELAARAVPLVEFKVRLALEKHGGDTPEAKGKAMEAVAQVLVDVSSDVVQEGYIERIAAEMAGPTGDSMAYQAAIRRTINKLLGRHGGKMESRGGAASPPLVTKPSVNPLEAVETSLLQRAIHHPGIWAMIDNELGNYTFINPHHQAIANSARQLLAADGASDLAPRLLEHITEEPQRQALLQVMTDPLVTTKPEVEAMDCIKNIKRLGILKQMEEINQQITASASGGNMPDPSLMQRLMVLKREQMLLGR